MTAPKSKPKPKPKSAPLPAGNGLGLPQGGEGPTAQTKKLGVHPLDTSAVALDIGGSKGAHGRLVLPSSVQPFGWAESLVLAKSKQQMDFFPAYDDGSDRSTSSVWACKSCTKNVQILAVAATLFGSITAMQLVAALAANSNALLVDCICMAVDTLSFCGNIYGECSADRERTRERERRAGDDACAHKGGGDDGQQGAPAREGGAMMTQLLGAGFSLLVLVGFSSWFLAEAAQAIAAPDEDAEDVDPWIVFGFALLGICFDGASLCAFYCWGASLLGDMDPETLNMGSAFMHVFSDSLRSITTLVESVLIFSFPEVSSATFDAWATLVVAGLVLVATVPPLIGWARSLGRCGRTVGYEALADVRDP